MSEIEKSNLDRQIDFKSFAEDAPVMLWLTNNKGDVIFTNNEYKNFIGQDKVEQLGGKAWFHALHPEDKDYCLSVFKDAFETHKGFEMEYRLQRRDGEYRHFIDHGEAFIDNNGVFSGFIGSSTDITEQKISEDMLKKSHQELIQYNKEMSLINKLNSYLQVCRSIKETYPVISSYLNQIFPQCSGSLYLFNEKKLLVEAMAIWGSEAQKIENMAVLTPDDCWALRQGKKHTYSNLDHNKGLICNHVEDSLESYTCEPVIAQGDMLGVLHTSHPTAHLKSYDDKKNYIHSRQRLIKIVADNLALSLVSLKLREALKVQSIRDPLTSLYNRRYMEESLEREIQKSARSNENLGIIMADIDHFKKFNDNFGHDAGDTVLIEFSHALRDYFRASDIVCRYGGEEFIIILPKTNKDEVAKRAQGICHFISTLKIQYESKTLPSITASFGVAYMDKKEKKNKSALIKQADIALYQAKDKGRNCVVISEA